MLSIALKQLRTRNTEKDDYLMATTLYEGTQDFAVGDIKIEINRQVALGYIVEPDLTDEELLMVAEIKQYGFDLVGAIEKVQDGDYRFYEDIFEMSDLAQEIAEETGMLQSIPENLRMYFDYEPFGRDLEIEGTFIWTSKGIIEVIQ